MLDWEKPEVLRRKKRRRRKTKNREGVWEDEDNNIVNLSRKLIYSLFNSRGKCLNGHYPVSL